MEGFKRVQNNPQEVFQNLATLLTLHFLTISTNISLGIQSKNHY